MTSRYEIHPVAALFPEMPEEEFSAFREDVRKNGLREAIVLFENRILDGRHRQRACDETGTQARYRGWSGSPEELVSYVISTNLRRRHLTEAQRAMIAAELAQFHHGGSRRGDFQGANLRLENLSRSKTAEMLNVSERTVDAAAKVTTQGSPALVQAVKQGKVSVSTAAAIAEEPVESQEQIVARGEKEIIAKAKEIKLTRRDERKQKRMNELVAKAANFELEPVADEEIQVICADARDLLDYVEPGSVDLVITSPPYNVSMPYDGYPDNLSEDAYRDLLGSVFSRCEVALKDGGRICVVVPLGVDRNPYKPFAPFIHEILDECGFVSRGWIVWDKNNVGNRTSWGSFRSFTAPSLRDRIEIILVAHKGTDTLTAPEGALAEDVRGVHSAFLRDPNYFAELTQNYWRVQPETRFADAHPAPFPLVLAQRLIHLFAYPDALVVDPFAGTGTVALAAKQNGCRAVALDQSMVYCALARERLENDA